MKTILFIHHSSELYGSDKVLLNIVTGLNKDDFHPIVFLPSYGLLTDAMSRAGIEFYVAPIATLSRKTLTFKGIIALPIKLIHSLYRMNRILKGKSVDIVHSNTLATLTGAIWAKMHRVSHVWHVHEIIVHPKIACRLYPWMIDKLSVKVICVSNGVRDWLVSYKQNLINKCTVIWNGVKIYSEDTGYEGEDLRSRLGVGEKDVLVTLIGRINRLKGQKLLLAAANILWTQNIRDIHFLMVGSPPKGQDVFLTDLEEQISIAPAASNIHRMEFVEDLRDVWRASDIAVVPSTEPESFGLVILEAMLSKKPVIASAHGGFLEIMVDGETGVLFKPNDAEDLSRSINRLADNWEMRVEMGEAGYHRLQEHFLFHDKVSKFVSIYNSL